jgi:hypothetical protein
VSARREPRSRDRRGYVKHARPTSCGTEDRRRHPAPTGPRHVPSPVDRALAAEAAAGCWTRFIGCGCLNRISRNGEEWLNSPSRRPDPGTKGGTEAPAAVTPEPERSASVPGRSPSGAGRSTFGSEGVTAAWEHPTPALERLGSGPKEPTSESSDPLPDRAGPVPHRSG